MCCCLVRLVLWIVQADLPAHRPKPSPPGPDLRYHVLQQIQPVFGLLATSSLLFLGCESLAEPRRGDCWKVLLQVEWGQKLGLGVMSWVLS